MTPGARLYAVRLACGDGFRKAETLEDFSARVQKKTGKYYDPATLSLLERMKQQWKLEDVETFAAVDPLRRGRAWLATFDGSAQAGEVPANEKARLEAGLNESLQHDSTKQAGGKKRRRSGNGGR